MKTAHYTPLLAFALLFSACSGNEQESTATAPVPATDVNQVQPGQTPAKTVALNPAHGQPGHNCALPVGAPLDGTPLPRLVNPSLNPLPVQTPVAPGTNPPHGQPGHDCSIPVGAPLGKK